ncbi:DUF6484 domain-containing protein [Paraliomyxa miuraensis]|uniref:DUF6484 domain-containing protein n=1 Tax=Paraliomyxa miuraensis TaxID=376150 RepID=UPI00225868AA|nr:DUF6484 domain-containing protein [Paraliomyxa miuraensis]MCX4241407.1 DUF6484 domain-containing protein [Paraliomyxa miuraensis]
MANDHDSSVLKLPVGPSAPRLGSHAVTVVRLERDGTPVVEVDGQPIRARATVAVAPQDVGGQAMVTFLEGDPSQPVITGLFVEPKAPPRRRHLQLRADELDLQAASKITLQCGKASITLHRDGKVVVRGTHVLSRATGVNRIRGGSVELN